MANFRALREGKYTLELRSIFEGGERGPVTAFSFSVIPPWYRHPATWVALIVVTLSLICLVFFALIRRKRKEISRLREAIELRREAERQLRDLNAVCVAVSDVSSQLIHLPVFQIVEKLPDLLRQIGEGIGAGRSQVCLSREWREGGDAPGVLAHWNMPIAGGLPCREEWESPPRSEGEILGICEGTDVIVPLILNERLSGYFRFADLEEKRVDSPHREFVTREVTRAVCSIAAILEKYELYHEMRALRRKAINAEEKERTRIARELHDQFGGNLTGLVFLTQDLWNRLSAEQSPHLNRLEKVKSQIQDLFPDLRRLCSELRPAILDEMSLEDSLQWICSTFEQTTNIPCKFSYRVSDELELSDEVAFTLYRIAQELLTNVARHAEATEASVAVNSLERSREIIMQVKDNGVGISEDWHSRKGHYGMQGVSERLSILCGRMQVTRRDGGGTVITVIVPEEVAVQGLCGMEEPVGGI